MITIDKTQTIDELKQHINHHREELLSIMQDFHYTQNVLEPELNFQYETHFGKLETALEKKKEEEEILRKKYDLINKKQNKGEEITTKTIKHVEQIVLSELELKKRLRINRINEERKRILNSQQEEKLPKLYRDLVKLLHPDMNNESDLFHKFWYNVQDAYKSKDIHRLQLFYETLCAEKRRKYYEDQIKEELALRNELRQLKMNIGVEKRRLERLKKNEPFSLSQKLKDSNWIKIRQNRIRQTIYNLENSIKVTQRMLETIPNMQFH